MVAISGALVSMFIASSASAGIVYTLKALIVIIVGGPGRMAGAIAAGCFSASRASRRLSCRSRTDACDQLLDPDPRPSDQADGTVRPWLTRPRRGGYCWRRPSSAPYSPRCRFGLSGYGVSSGIVYFANIALATAWAIFSGPTRYISLATATFVGIGMYTLAFTLRERGAPAGAGARRHCRVPLRLDRRAVHAPPAGRLFRHLHVRPDGADAPAGQLVRDQHHQQGEPLHRGQHRRDRRSTRCCSSWQ